MFIKLKEKINLLFKKNEEVGPMADGTPEEEVGPMADGTPESVNNEPVNPVPEEKRSNGKKILICLDNGHAKQTPGKRSPQFEDGSRLFEYQYNRELVHMIDEKLKELGLETFIVTPEEDEDISLTERANRINEKCKKYLCLAVSVHGNAGGNGKDWYSANGWEVYTTIGETNSDKLARCFGNEFKKIFPNKKYRGEKERNFTIIQKTNCPIVLTENFFYDNKEECKFMMQPETKEKIAQLHVNAFVNYINLYLKK